MFEGVSHKLVDKECFQGQSLGKYLKLSLVLM